MKITKIKIKLVEFLDKATHTFGNDSLEALFIHSLYMQACTYQARGITRMPRKQAKRGIKKVKNILENA